MKYLSDIMKEEKIPVSERLQGAAIVFFGTIFSSITAIFIAPFSAWTKFWASKRLVIDMTKIPIGMTNQAMGAGLISPNAVEEDAQNKLKNMFDLREDWQRKHDELYKDDDKEGE